MIYLDNAATTWPKPIAVKDAVYDAFDNYGANPGRSAFKMSIDTSRLIFNGREALADFFNAPHSNRMIYTHNTTDGLNIAISGCLNYGDQVLYSGVEHNSSWRPLKTLDSQGIINAQMIPVDRQGHLDMQAFEKMLKPTTKMVVIAHASNLTGVIQPLEEIGRLTRKNHCLLLVDAAQSAGQVKIDIQKQNIDLLAFPGHKSLYGPTGIGALYVAENVPIRALRQGGTGSDSQNWRQPEIFPDYLECGTLNTLGIAGLMAGLDHVNSIGVKAIKEQMNELNRHFIAELKNIAGVEVYGPDIDEIRTPVVAINIKDLSPGAVGMELDEKFDIGIRAGFHCSPLAHQAIGTEKRGAVRFSFSTFTTKKELDTAIDAVNQIAKNN